MPRLLNRYIVKELVFPFLAGVLSFSAIFAGTSALPTTINIATNYHVDLITSLQFFITKMPEIVGYSFLLSMLFSTLLMCGRLSADNEITAMRAGGVSIFRITLPVLLVGFIVSIVAFSFNEFVVPASNTLRDTLLLKMMNQQETNPQIKDNVNIPEYKNGYLVRMMYANHVEGNVLKDVSISEYDKGRFVRIIFAKEALWQKEGGWIFKEGIIHQFSGDKYSAYVIEFKEERINIDININEVHQSEKNVEVMNIVELYNYIQRKKSTGNDVLLLLVKLNQKVAIPFACFVFTLLGAPMGIRPQRTSSSIGMGLTLLVVFMYYTIMAIGQWLGMSGIASPFLGAWLPNLVVGFIGATMLYKKATE